MTDEPRDVDGLRADGTLTDEALFDAIHMGDESWFWPVGGEAASVSDVLRDLQQTRTRLAAADRENAELRGEVERLQRRLFPGQGESYTNEVERQRVVIDQMATIAKTATGERDDLRAQLAAAQTQPAEARAWLALVRRWESCGESTGIASNRCMLPPRHVGAHDCQLVPGSFAYFAALSAAPQPEPDDDGEDDASPFPCWDLGHAPCRFDKRPINASFHPDIEEEPLVMVDVDDAPPASDEPARCEPHALTEYGTTNCPVEGVRANVDDGECSACGAKVGPAASGTPDGGS